MSFGILTTTLQSETMQAHRCEINGGYMRWTSIYSVSITTILVLTSFTVDACRFTPLEWQQPVEKHAIQGMIGHRKHTTWERDRNRNFIDDEIEKRFRTGEIVNVIVDLNRCVPTDQLVKMFSEFGKVTYVGRLVTFVMLEDVKVDLLPKLAERPEVAMIEWQPPGQIMNDVSARTVQSRTSNTFSPNTAQDQGFTGNNVAIAILDTGVDDGLNRQESFPAAKFVAGFNARVYEDTNANGVDDSCEPGPLGNGVCTDPDDEPANGTTNPTDVHSHGSHVAGSALGSGAANRTCSNPGDASPTNCAGVAPNARLVDIQICNALGNCATQDVAEALDWLGINAGRFNIRVANMSIGFCTDDDGTNAMSQQVNYVASLGVFMAVAHGNASNCGLAAGTVRTMFPGSASFAITVGGINDRDTLARADDTNYSSFLRGPRNDFNVATPNLLALKPDITAPGENIISAQRNTSNQYFSSSGTSMAAPHVAGAGAVIIQARPTIDPGSLKDLLKRTADIGRNTAAFPAVDASWDTGFGAGILNVNAALAASTTDVHFPNCVGAPPVAGQACALTPPMPSWNNTVDISTATPPRVGIANTIRAQVRNNGAVPATVLVNFGVYVFAIGNNRFFHVGTQSVTVPPLTTVTVSQAWTPTASNHQCVQVTIDFGLDTDFSNNVTQRNLQVAPSVFDVQVENPFMVPAKILLEAKSDREGWTCRIKDTSFTIDPLRDCPRRVKVEFDAPPGTKPGEFANCSVAGTAVPSGQDKSYPIGGVTVQTFVPRPCRIVGMVVDEKGNPVRGASLTLVRMPHGDQEKPDYEAIMKEQSKRDKPVKLATDAEGIFDATFTPNVRQLVQVVKAQVGQGHVVVRFDCGAGKTTFVLAQDKVTALE
jgi:subtilisin family serine protease